jgi:hypothetical protein
MLMMPSKEEALAVLETSISNIWQVYEDSNPEDKSVSSPHRALLHNMLMHLQQAVEQSKEFQ